MEKIGFNWGSLQVGGGIRLSYIVELHVNWPGRLSYKRNERIYHRKRKVENRIHSGVSINRIGLIL